VSPCGFLDTAKPGVHYAKRDVAGIPVARPLRLRHARTEVKALS
jgi:hypothetical protein